MVADNRNIDNFWASHYFNLVQLCDRKPNEANNKPSEVNENMGCVLRRSLMFRSFGPDSQLKMMAIVSLPVQGEHGLFQPK